MALVLAYPGQNFYQTLVLGDADSVVTDKEISLDLVPQPISDGTPPPLISARAAFIFDPSSGTVLYQKNPDTRLFPASTTKIMTALVSLDTYHLGDVINVNTGKGVVGHSVDLQNGAHFTVSDILKALLISSGNDAALTLAENHPGGYQWFVSDMNRKAKELNLSNTTFTNVSGLEDVNHKTTVHDLALLAKVAIEEPFIKDTVSKTEDTITDTTGTFNYHLETTNQLLGKIDGLIGLKTGWTENAGECLVTYTVRDGHSIIAVVLGSVDRFGESAALINWTFSSHSWVDF